MMTTPITHQRVQDWDSAEALDWPRLRETLETIIRDGGALEEPVDEEHNTHNGEQGSEGDTKSGAEREQLNDPAVPAGSVASFRRSIISRLRQQKSTRSSFHPRPKDSQPLDQQKSNPLNAGNNPIGSLELTHPKSLHLHVILLEGFLLYPPPPPPPSPSHPTIPPSSSPPQSPLLPSSIFTLRLFLPITLPTVLSRRATRPGYDTSAGAFWVDPPGYVEEVVWRHYVRDQGWLFGGGDVENGLWDGDKGGIICAPGRGEGGLEMLLGWGVERVWEVVEGVL